MASRPLSILTVCGAGVGSSLMLKFNVREILDRHRIEHVINNADMTTAKGQSADIVITTRDLLHAIEGARGFRKIVVLENLVSKTELESKLLPVCQELLQAP